MISSFLDKAKLVAFVVGGLFIAYKLFFRSKTKRNLYIPDPQPNPNPLPKPDPQEIDLKKVSR